MMYQGAVGAFLKKTRSTCRWPVSSPADGGPRSMAAQHGERQRVRGPVEFLTGCAEGSDDESEPEYTSTAVV